MRPCSWYFSNRLIRRRIACHRQIALGFCRRMQWSYQDKEMYESSQSLNKTSAGFAEIATPRRVVLTGG